MIERVPFTITHTRHNAFLFSILCNIMFLHEQQNITNEEKKKNKKQKQTKNNTLCKKKKINLIN
jgi:hypothetical protein